MSWNVANVKVFAGRLGQTSRQPVLITSDNGDSFSVELHRSINLATDPGLLDRWAAGDLHVVTDPASNTSHRMVMPIACHDPRRRVFALVIPSELRWNEFRLRQDLLEDLARETEEVPEYVRNFSVVYDLEKLRDLESGVLEATPAEVTTLTASEELAASKELARQRQQLEEEREKLRIEREQLDEVRSRFDREREQLDELQERVNAERAELEAVHKEQRSVADRLNEEGRALAAAQTGNATTEEGTQVVTDDQFIEIVDESELEDSFAEESEVEEVAVQDVVDHVSVEPSERGPSQLGDLLAKGRTRAVKIVRNRVVALAQLATEEADKLLDGEPTFFIQLHDVDGYPVVGLLLAQLDERQQAVKTFGWAVDPAADGDRLILERLQKDASLVVAFYDADGKKHRAVDVRTPFASNVGWIQKRAAQMLSKTKSTFEKAREAFTATDFESLGTMRHNFTRDSFAELDSPSQVKLAAGIVGYWSKADTFEYLVANRCFPLHHFRALQERVVRAAADAGIFLNEPLRAIALELGIARDEEALVELLTANFAEAAISIRKNDLEPADQWENWDALLGLGDDLGVPPDPDVVELAEVSLKRAQEAEELVEKFENELTTVEDPRRRGGRLDELIVAKRSESTGITYFLPNDAVIDTFDDLATMDRADLELLLNDANGRLEAAQMLIERFGASATSKVLEAAENMSSPEVAALARFLETKAGGLEGELVRSVESGGPSAVYVAARGLARLRSTSAIPALIDAYGDPKRAGDQERLAEALAEYGEKLMPALTRAIKRDGAQDALVLLLGHIENRVPGTLSELSKDRSKNLREAARLARQQRESKSA